MIEFNLNFGKESLILINTQLRRFNSTYDQDFNRYKPEKENL